MKSIFKKNLFGTVIIIIVFAGFYVSFVLGQHSSKYVRNSKKVGRKKNTKKSKSTKGDRRKKGAQNVSELTFYGEAIAYNEVKIQGEQGGKIIYLKHRPGDKVEKNEILVKFNTKKLLLQIKKAGIEKKAILTQIQDAKLKVEISQGNLKRAQRLFDRKAISREDFEQNTNDLALAESNLKKIKTSFEQANISLKLLEEQKKDSVIVSPIKGIVNKKYYNLKEIYRSGDSLYHIVSLDKMYINVRVPENSIASIRPGTKAKAFFSALDTDYTGYVEKLPPGNTEDKYNFIVQVVVKNKKHAIRPGMFAKVEFIMGKKKKK